MNLTCHQKMEIIARIFERAAKRALRQKKFTREALTTKDCERIYELARSPETNPKDAK